MTSSSLWKWAKAVMPGSECPTLKQVKITCSPLKWTISSWKLSFKKMNIKNKQENLGKLAGLNKWPTFVTYLEKLEEAIAMKEEFQKMERLTFSSKFYAINGSRILHQLSLLVWR